jgi:hypothetical protein
MTKTYEVIRSTEGFVYVVVHPGNGREFDTTLEHVVLHSHTGMETGYGGSGPADLALSILVDFLGASPKRVKRVWERPTLQDSETIEFEAIRMHQGFKWHFVAGRQIDPGETYKISGDEIQDWLRNVRVGRRMAPDSEGMKQV